MCDYSLQTVRSRPARVGEKLRTQHFNTGTIGFASPEDSTTAVCVLPGTELAFATAMRCNRLRLLGWKPKVLNHTMAIFRQVNKQNPRTHHDALELPDGKMVLLTELVEGQEATVLQLPAQPVTAAETKAQERVRHVDWNPASLEAEFGAFAWSSIKEETSSSGQHLISASFLDAQTRCMIIVQSWSHKYGDENHG
jgi:hypothetical protein